MAQSRKQLVWALAACAAVVAQGMPKAVCHACDQPCCARRDSGHGPSVTKHCVESASHCQLCGTKAEGRPPRTTERPCHCRLNARHVQPVSLSRSTLPTFADGDWAVGSAGVPPAVPQLLGVGREYVAALLAVPIRPPRILYGVWRN